MAAFPTALEGREPSRLGPAAPTPGPTPVFRSREPSPRQEAAGGRGGLRGAAPATPGTHRAPAWVLAPLSGVRSPEAVAMDPPQPGAYSPFCPPCGLEPGSAPYPAWDPADGDPGPPTCLDPFVQAFGRPWGLGPQVSGALSWPPPLGFTPLLPQLDPAGGDGGSWGPDPSAQCLYPELVPPSYGPHSSYQDPGLAGSEVFSRLLGPADWPPDSACGSQATDHYFKVPESSWVPSESWPGAEVTMPGCEQPPTGAAGQVSGCQGAPHQSRLQHPGRASCYRAPPILDPLRPGPGLFARLQPSPGSCSPPPPSPTLHPDTPRVNVGPRFQAELPALRDLALAWRDPNRAVLAWRPWPRLEEDPGTQSHVEALLDVACSSAVPGGGTNRELALHCLCRAHGDVRAALEMLLLQNPAWPPQHSLGSYHYTGSDAWTLHERRQFAKAFAQHGKDFALIQRAVPSKQLRQCVEFYYLHKSRPGRDQRRQGPSEALDTAPGTCFPCQRCGRSFVKIKSRNAHMKIHRPHQPTGEGPRPLPLPPQQCLL